MRDLWRRMVEVGWLGENKNFQHYVMPCLASRLAATTFKLFPQRSSQHRHGPSWSTRRSPIVSATSSAWSKGIEWSKWVRFLEVRANFPLSSAVSNSSTDFCGLRSLHLKNYLEISVLRRLLEFSSEESSQLGRGETCWCQLEAQ